MKLARRKANDPRTKQATQRGVDISKPKRFAHDHVEEQMVRLASFPRLNPYPVIELDPSGKVVYFNPAMEKVLKEMGKDERNCQAFVPSDFNDILQTWDRVSELTFHREVPFGEKIFWSTFHLVPQFSVVRVYNRDITEQRRVERALLRNITIQDSIGKVLNSALTCGSEEELGQACLEAAEKITESKFGFIDEIRQDGLLHNIAISDPGWEMCAIYDKTVYPRPPPRKFKIGGLFGKALTDGKGFFSNDPASHPDRKGLPLGHPPLSCFMGVPLISQGQTIGMIGVANRPGGYGPEDQEALEALTPVVVEAFHRKRAEEALHKAHDELERRVEERTAELREAYAKLEKEVAERKQVEEQLRHSHKMEALGTLTGGIAHDFNNMLAAILGFSEMCLDEAPKDTMLHKNLTHIVDSSLRARNLIKQLLAFSRKAEYEVRPIRLTPLIKETARLLRASIPATVTIEVNARATSDVIMADSTGVQQVIMNLGINAADAMEKKGGKLVISLSDAKIDSGSRGTALPPGVYAKLTVQDTGIGMDAELQQKIFDPFFTTKTPGKGTGMGLAVVYGIVKGLKGDIIVESKPGKGSNFQVFFPRVFADAPSRASKQLEGVAGKGKVLFIDDDELLMGLGKDTLERLGYTVTAVSSGTKALKLFSKDPRLFDLVITDQTMPELTGLRLAKRLLKIRRDIPIILLTGHSDAVTPKTIRAAGIREFLMKPLARLELGDAVRRVLAITPDAAVALQ